jgi:AAA domain
MTQATSANGHISPFRGSILCPICGGTEDDARGSGKRCHGFLSSDRQYAHCSREEHAGNAACEPNSNTYAHRLKGPCLCGQEHAPAEPKAERKTIDKTYDYEGVEGKLAFQVVRLRPKGFRQRRPDGKGGWIWNLQGVEPFLYRRNELRTANPAELVYIVEGEKDVDRLRSFGLVATCNPMGAGKWKDRYAEDLDERHVVILPDADEAGQAHAQQVARSVSPRATSVRVVELPGLPDKGDVSWWLDHGHTIENLKRVAAEAPTWEPKPSATGPGRGGHTGANGKADGPSEPPDYGAMSDEDLGMIRADQVRTAAVRWRWKYRLAAGTMAVIAGDGGTGKGLIQLYAAAMVSVGGPWPDGEGSAEQGDVIILSAEDNPCDTIVPRLQAMGADLSKITILRARYVIRREGKPDLIHPASFQDRDYFKKVLDRRPGCRLFTVDPLPSYLGRGVNDSKNAEIRQVLEPFLVEVIEPRDICVFASTHLNKSVDVRTPVYRIVGSIAYGNLPRNTHIVARDPEDAGRRYLKQAKCNNAPDDLDAIAYRVEMRTVLSSDGEPIETAVPVFEAQTVKIDLGQMMGGKSEKRRGPEPEKAREIAEWLFDFLTDLGMPTPLGAVFDAAGEKGFMGTKQTDGKWSNPRSLYRARDELAKLPEPRAGWQVIDFKAAVRDGGREITYWQLIEAVDAGEPEAGQPF